MKATLVVPIAVFSTLVFFYIRETDALKCYVCQDCLDTYDGAHLQNCSRNVDKCIKMVLMSGETDRLCAEKNDKHKCTGRGNGRSKRSLEDEIDDCLPKRRTVRQLLGGDGGGSSSSGSSSKNKNKEKQKEEKKGDKEASEIHCCGEDGCNGSIRLSSSAYSPLVIIFSFLLPTLLLSNSFSPCHYFRYVN